MYAKLQVKGKLELISGLHIGGSTAFSAIGAVDAPIVKDVVTGLPMIPGSSLKGKMRTLLSRKYNEKPVEPKEDHIKLARLFGSSERKSKKSDVFDGQNESIKEENKGVLLSRVLFSDMILENWNRLEEKGVPAKTEVKFENTISRLTGVANPRQIERAIRGSEFDVEIIYEHNHDIDEQQIKEDFKILAEGFRLLQYDYLGGHGSRGYGKVKFKNLNVSCVFGDFEQSRLQELNHLFEEFNETQPNN